MQQLSKKIKAVLISTVIILHSIGIPLYAASLRSVALTMGTSTLLYFEGNAPFFSAPDEVLRVSYPASVNSDQNVWRVTITDAPGGGQRFGLVGWGLNGLNVSQATYLVFWVRGNVGGEPFEIGLQDKNFASYRIRDTGSINHPNLSDYILGGGTTITTAYQRIRIPVSEFSSHGVNLANLDAFQIISVAPDGQNIVVFVDAMGFE